MLVFNSEILDTKLSYKVRVIKIKLIEIKNRKLRNRKPFSDQKFISVEIFKVCGINKVLML